jgi:hypothetical protein
MGKYQLDDKGHQSVRKFHEKLIRKSDKQAKLEALRAQYLSKKKSGGK